jgi:hypothetical protein
MPLSPLSLSTLPLRTNSTLTNCQPTSHPPLWFKTFLAWTFTEILPGTFTRKKADFAHHRYPILAPLPSLGRATQPVEECDAAGPFIYFVLDGRGTICYVGKSQESNVIARWVRPGVGGPSSHYWTHSTKSGGSVFNIADGLRRGDGPYSLRYAPLATLTPQLAAEFDIAADAPTALALRRMEDGLLRTLLPAWNR